MTHLDGSLQRLLLLDAFLKSQVGEFPSHAEALVRREGKVTMGTLETMGRMRRATKEAMRNLGRATWDPKCKVFIGGLKSSMGRVQLKEVFSKYGSVRNCWVAKKPGGFGFVEMVSARGAARAVRGLDGTQVWGKQVRVAMSHAKEGQPGVEDSKRNLTSETRGGRGSDDRRCKTRDGGESRKWRRRRARRSRSRDGGRSSRERERNRYSEEKSRKHEKCKNSSNSLGVRKYKNGDVAISETNREVAKQCNKMEDKNQNFENYDQRSRPSSSQVRKRNDSSSSSSSSPSSRYKKRKRKDSTSSSSSSSNTSDWEAPWERNDNQGKKKKGSNDEKCFEVKQ